MKRIIASMVAAVTLLATVGCGGSSPSQSDMLRLAMERKKAQQVAGTETDSNAAPAANETTPPPTPSPKALPEEASAAAALTVTPEAIIEQEPPKRESPQVVKDNQKPDKPLSVTERRRRTIENLRRIGEALNRYQREKGRFPTPAIYDWRSSPLLSWRVELLPSLGYEDLHKQFHLDEPWDSPHNRKLVPLIPPVYQSPERFDEQTNYMVPLSSGTAFPGRQGVVVDNVEDGVANTVVLLEVDDERAVPWTSPGDYRMNYAKPADGMGELRSGHFFAVWGDGAVGQIPVDQAAKHWKAMMSIDGGEPFSAFQISQAPVVEPAPSQRVADAPADIENTDNLAMREPASNEPTTEQAPGSPKETERPDKLTQEEDNRLPVPTESARRVARDLYREIFQSEYEDAVTDEEKLEFAARMHAVALAAARRSDDVRLIHTITERREEITNARFAFRQVAHLIDVLAADPSHAEANLAVGEYCCLAKGQWEDGLPMLSRGSDKRLARLAERELKPPKDTHGKVALADSWWDASDGTSKYCQAMRSRAAHWYEQALPELEAGLERVKAEIRIKQVE